MANIFLIGYRCTGKSSVGRTVAKKIGWNFIDADERMMKNLGESVSEIVSRGGWPLFRSLEKDTLRSICSSRRQVVATGGGVVTDDENIDLMKQNGAVVWLRASPQTILKRMLQDNHTDDLRPPLTDRGLEVEIEETLEKRTSLYRTAMNVDVNTENKTLSEVSSEVISLLVRIGCIEIPPDNVCGQ
jgi:shikimate kinase